MKQLFGMLCASALIGITATAQGQTVNIYSTRQDDLIAPVLDAFTAATGIDTEVLFLKKGLVDRVVAEAFVQDGQVDDNRTCLDRTS